MTFKMRFKILHFNFNSFFADATSCNGLGKDYQYILGKCYYIEENHLNQADASENCKNRFGVHGNGILFEPKDKNTNDKVIDFARNLIKSNQLNMPAQFYIGIMDYYRILFVSNNWHRLGNAKKLPNNNWQYLSNNKKLSWTNWEFGKPEGLNKNCVVILYRNNQWHDIDCANKYSSICEMTTALLEDLKTI